MVSFPFKFSLFKTMFEAGDAQVEGWKLHPSHPEFF